MDRILAAAEGLLDEGTFDQATIAEIVRRAETSVGAFYARFSDKANLLHALEERALRDVAAAFDEVLETGHDPARTLEMVIEDAIRRVLKVYRTRRGVIRALALHARTRTDDVVSERSQRLNRNVWSGVREMLTAHSAVITHPDPDLAIDLGLAAVSAALRELIIFSEAGLTPVSIEDDALVRELTHLYVRYLGAPTVTRPSTS